MALIIRILGFRVRHLVPEDGGFQGLIPLKVSRDGQDIYRCLSRQLYRTEDAWPVLKLKSLKYAIKNEAEILSKVFHQISHVLPRIFPFKIRYIHYKIVIAYC